MPVGVTDRTSGSPSAPRPVSTTRTAPTTIWIAGSLVGVITLLAGCSDLGPEPQQPRETDARPAAAPSQAGRSPDTSRDGQLATTVRLSFAGDVMFEGDVANLLDSPGAGLAPITAAVSVADFTMVNLESSITTRGTRDPKALEDEDNRYHFRAGAESLIALKAGGIDAVSIANNHGVDFGAEGLADTLRVKAAGVLPVVGIGRDAAEAHAPHLVTLKGQPFAFFAADASFLESTEPHWQAGPATPGLAAARGPGLNALLAGVRRATADGNAVVVYLHWGRENSADVTAEQRALALALSGAGAAAVVGSHTHRLQGAGWLGSTYVAYGLGNFIWYHGERGENTGLLDLTVRNGRVVADGWRPAVIPAEGGLPRFQAGAAAAEAARAWRTLRSRAGLAARPSGKPPAVPAPPITPRFTSSISAITPALRQRMASSYREGCPVPLENLRYLQLSHWDFTGRVRQGELIVAAKHARAMVGVFGRLYAANFPIERMELVSNFAGDDDDSMAANNSSAFNCRPVAGTDRWSQHSFGAAVDLNPIQNPYVTDSIAPPAGAPYAQPSARQASVKGLIAADSAVVRTFAEAGWEWGGSWESPKDYQHFSAIGS